MTKGLKDKVAVVSGATAGIGRAVALRLAAEGMNVFITGRREDRLKEVKECKESHGRIFPVLCDMTKEDEVVALFRKVQEQFNTLHVLVNNAGTALYTKVANCESSKWRDMFELNVISVGVASREALKLMELACIDEGHIINISSIAAHGVPDIVGKHVYNGSKHALRLITEGLRAELTEKKSSIKVSMISPGSVATEIGAVGGWMAVATQFDEPVPTLKADDIADTVVYLLNLPSNVQVSDMIVRPLREKILT